MFKTFTRKKNSHYCCLFTIKFHFLLILLSVGAKESLSYSSPENKKYPLMITPAQMSQDIDFYIKTLKDTHPNLYAYTNKQEFKEAIDSTRKVCQKDEMSIDQFYFQIAWLAGQLKNGHTYISKPQGWKDRICKDIFPAYFWINENKVYLTSGPGSDEKLKRSQILEIENESANKILQNYLSLCPREGHAFNLNAVNDNSFLWYCLGINYQKDKLTVTLKDEFSQNQRIEISKKPYEEVFRKATKTSSSTHRSTVSYSYLSNIETGTIKIMSFGPETFNDEIKKCFTDLKNKNAKNLIIDIRNCPGGSSKFSDNLICYLTDKEFTNCIGGRLRYSKLYQKQRGKQPNHSIKSFISLFSGGNLSIIPNTIQPQDNPLRFNGQVYVLINGGTYSTADTFANTAKYHNLATLIGEETGEKMVNYGDALFFELPNSKLSCAVACKEFIMVGANKSNSSKSTQPDIPIHPSLDDILNHRDPIMEYALEICKNGMIK